MDEGAAMGILHVRADASLRDRRSYHRGSPEWSDDHEADGPVVRDA
jgi:hypothetical protein